MNKKLRFAVFGNVYQTKKSAGAGRVLSCLYDRDADVYIEEDFYDFLKNGHDITVKPTRLFRGADFDADFVISMGGDGTLLKAAMHVGDKQTPIIGVNMGHLGFLASITIDKIEQALDAVYDGDCTIADHSAVELSVIDGEACRGSFALNDIAVLKRDNASMISIRVEINGEYLVTYRADGLIISTPTGSTAYSLSNGGPIIVPDTGVLCLTPVAPHSLNIRPIVVPDTAKIGLTVESRSHNFLVAVDGRSEKCPDRARLCISKAFHYIRTVKAPGTSYISTLREKMMWGVDGRARG